MSREARPSRGARGRTGGSTICDGIPNGECVVASPFRRIDPTVIARSAPAIRSKNISTYTLIRAGGSFAAFLPRKSASLRAYSRCFLFAASSHAGDWNIFCLKNIVQNFHRSLLLTYRIASLSQNPSGLISAPFSDPGSRGSTSVRSKIHARYYPTGSPPADTPPSIVPA
jgi:hypothetical protein